MEAVVLAPQQLGRRSSGIIRFLEKFTAQNPIQEMYDALEDRGITPGEEVSAVTSYSLLFLHENVCLIVYGTRVLQNILVHHCC